MSILTSECKIYIIVKLINFGLIFNGCWLNIGTLIKPDLTLIYLSFLIYNNITKQKQRITIVQEMYVCNCWFILGSRVLFYEGGGKKIRILCKLHCCIHIFSLNEDCILCPQEIHPTSKYDLLTHVRWVHVSHLITIREMNLLMCRCSDIRSQGRDNSVRNHHWHCVDCWQPCVIPSKLKQHMLAKHKDKYNKHELKHLDRSSGGPPRKKSK